MPTQLVVPMKGAVDITQKLSSPVGCQGLDQLQTLLHRKLENRLVQIPIHHNKEPDHQSKHTDSHNETTPQCTQATYVAAARARPRTASML